MTTEQLLYAAVGALSSVVAFLAKAYIDYLIKDNTVWRNELMGAVKDVTVLFSTSHEARRKEHEEILRVLKARR